MLITLDIKNESMRDNFLNFVTTLDYIEIKQDIKIDETSKINNENKFSEFAGMWGNRDITANSIREQAWKR